MGSVYKQQNSRRWWIKYYSNGRVIRESTGTDNKTVAKQILKEREGKIAEGKRLSPQNLRFEHLERIAIEFTARRW